MDLAAFEAFTQTLTKNLSGDERVLGLVAVGSMAATNNQPDEWSDHDFIIVTTPGAEEEFRRSTQWLPSHQPLVLHFRETQHGVKALYADGHLLEFAVFDADEFLRVMKINSHRVLIDRAGFGELVRQVVEITKQWNLDRQRTEEFLFGQFLTHLLVGAGRHARGEQLSGYQFVKSYALADLLQLLARFLPGDAGLDSIDNFRRFERAYPALEAEINTALGLDTPRAALALLELAERELADKSKAYPTLAIAAVKAKLVQVQTAER
jgi:hypothetical protein